MYNEASGSSWHNSRWSSRRKKKTTHQSPSTAARDPNRQTGAFQGHQYYRYHRRRRTDLVIGTALQSLPIKQRLHRQLEQNSRRSMKNTALEQLVSEKDTLIRERTGWLKRSITGEEHLQIVIKPF